MDQLTLPAIYPLISALCVFFLGLFVFIKNPKKPLNFTFSLHALSISLWLFGTFMMFLNVDNYDMAIFWDRFIYGSVVFIPAFMYHFCLALTERRPNKLLYIAYALSIIFFFLSRTDYFVYDLFVYEWGVHTKAAFFHHIFLLYFTSYVVIWFFDVYRYYKELSSPFLKYQAKYFFAAFLILFTIGPTAYLPAYGISIYPFSYLSGLVFSIILAYAILKHRFMDTTVATGKVVTYLLTFLTIGFFGYAVSVLSSTFNISQSYQVISSAVLAGILFKPLFVAYENFSSRYLYYSFYSSQKILEELSGKLTKILDIDELADLTTKTIMDTMKLDRAVILLRDEETGKFDIKRNFGFKEENGISLVTDNFLTKHLKKTDKPLIYEELSLMISSTDKEMEKREIRKLQENMKRIEASLCNLLITKEKVVGMIVLGEKKSKDPYTDQDVKLIDSLCKQISVSVLNAKLYSQVEDLKNNLEERVEEQVKELKKAYKKLQRIDKAKTEFMSIVSHQLRTPLSIIKGHLSMVTEGVYDDDEGKKKKILQDVYDSNERLITLVNDVLNISRIQSGRVEISKEEVDMKEVTKKIVEKMKGSLNGKDVKLIFENPKEENLKTKADSSKIENALINLIDNAIKYTNQGEVRVSLRKEEDSLLVEIKDTGEGMNKEEIEKLFETFSRGDAGKKHWIQGAGLGLYIARQFIEMHDGKVWADSQGKGKGSQFYVTLPL